MRVFRKVLIANRGEIAVRIIRTCKELGLRTVAVYSDADRAMPHVLMADEAVHIGPSPSSESYLRGDRIIDAALASGAEAVHPGYGFLSENPRFARSVEEAGLCFVGPPASAMEAMGDKVVARTTAGRAHVPVVPGSPEPVATPEEAAAWCRQWGYPALLKAAAGGGGKGMRAVREESSLAAAFASAASEAASAFGDGRIYLEKLIEKPRHVEIQVLADGEGNVVYLGERECSVQRRHQKIVEESPSPLLDETLRAKMGETAVRLARACGYVNAGTMEFLVDQERHFYFLEMNTRLQVEHPVTELRTGLDLVALQLHIAAGGVLPFTQDGVRFSGHAIECRICAEDPATFLPETGRLTHLRPALGPGIREDRGFETGDEVPVYYDSLIAKLIAWAPTRTAAIAKMKRALREYEILGVRTNIPVCVAVLDDPGFAAGEYSTDLLASFSGSNPGDGFGPESRRAAAALCAILEGRGPRNGIAAPSGNGRRENGWKQQRALNW